MAARELRYFGDSILRRPSREVTAIDEKIQRLLADMVETMYSQKNAGGLAAPQVGVLKRVVVIDVGTGLYRLINPRIVKERGEQSCVEGCLSLPGRFGRTKRPRQVTVRALDELGNPITLTGKGELAKTLCHEIDHLDGVLFSDKVVKWL